MKSFLDCPHKNIQQFTECCLDCGYNIWTTEAEYLKDLERKYNTSPLKEAIRALEMKVNYRRNPSDLYHSDEQYYNHLKRMELEIKEQVANQQREMLGRIRVLEKKLEKLEKH
jgi:hypothetical protein